jgi:uncharacterized protein YihD (DUF1040 family)
MRDLQRIDQILEVLKDIWHLEPDLRLGQIVVIGVRPSEPCPQIFYAEDDALLQSLLDYHRTLAKRSSLDQR